MTPRRGRVRDASPVERGVIEAHGGRLVHLPRRAAERGRLVVTLALATAEEAPRAG